MLKVTNFFACIILSLLFHSLCKAEYPFRIRRADAFLGIHFDFHATDQDTEIGKTLNEQMVHAIIDKVQPDYIQVDCKGHLGFSSYPTDVGYRAGGFVQDPLAIWRKATAERGVALFVHYSGIWDNQAVAHHPEWAVIGADGKASEQRTSPFSDYVNQLLIPQIKELYQKYHIDGVWIDGECWAVVPDYNPKVLKRFCEISGLHDAPKDANDPNWPQWLEFQRQGFRDYLRHYVDTLHRECPGIQLTSNWAFTALMPEPVSADIDFISGDYSLSDSVREARWQARCIRHQGKPWDLMAWGFSGSKNQHYLYTTKTGIQLCREAAVVLAAGGGFQCFYRQRRDHAVELWQMEPMAQVARFCRARQKYCHKSNSVPQIALIYHVYAIYPSLNLPFWPHNQWGDARGILEALLDNQLHTDVLMDHQLKNDLSKWPVLVFPDWNRIEPELKEKLVMYVQNGGNLMIVGAHSARLFADVLNLSDLPAPQQQRCVLIHQDKFVEIDTPILSAVLPEYVETIGRLSPRFYPSDGKGTPAAGVWTLGHGKITVVFASLGNHYYDQTTTAVRDFIGMAAKRLLADPVVQLVGSHQVELVVNRKTIDGTPTLTIHLINTAGLHRDRSVFTHDQIGPIGPLMMTVRTDKKPSRISRQPGDVEIPFNYHDGKATILIPRLEIYDIYVVEE